jgi:hypothetical protein
MTVPVTRITQRHPYITTFQRKEKRNEQYSSEGI